MVKTAPAAGRRLPNPGSTEDTRPDLRTAPGGKKRKRKFKFKWPFAYARGMDLPFCFLVVLLVLIGTLMMYSASYPLALSSQNDSEFFLTKQLIYAAAGLVIMLIVSFIDFKNWKYLAIVVLAVVTILMVLVLILPTNHEAHRWLNLGFTEVQVSELGKFALILFISFWGDRFQKDMGTFLKGFLPCAVLTGIFLALLLLEPHFSGMVIMLLLAYVMMFIAGVKKRYILLMTLVIIAAAFIFLQIKGFGYAEDRLAGWGQALNPTPEMYDKTRQTRNSIYAIGSGGVLGTGLGQSRQKYLYIPEVQNDFVFSVVCEELGLVGAGIILLLFSLLVIRGITISKNVQDPFGVMLGVGLSCQIGLQVILNVLVITDWLPNTGISFPFFSYGGSSILVLTTQMGIILSISRQSKLEK